MTTPNSEVKRKELVFVDHAFCGDDLLNAIWSKTDWVVYW
jgi:hypothetical protein